MATTNPALAEALGRAHALLLEDLRGLEEAAHSAPGEGRADLSARLATVQRTIEAHFRFEEHGGYMDAVRLCEPRLERAVQELADEHRALAQSLEALLRESRAPGRGDALREGIRGWVERVRRHETRENKLIHNAFSVDLDAGD